MANTKQKKPTYAFIAQNPQTGEVIERKIIATSEESVRTYIYERNFTPINVEKVETTGLNTELSFGKGRRPKTKDLAVWARNFATMYNAGLPIARVLAILEEQTSNKRLKETTEDVRVDVENGTTFGDALARHPDIFPELVFNMVRAGEAGGSLDETLKELSDTLEAEVRLKSKIKSAMTYPIVVFVMAIVMCIVMLLFIVPTFSNLFESLGGELPLPTQILVMLSNFLKVAIIPLAVLAIIGFLWWRKNKREQWVRNIIDPLKLKIPIFGKLFQMVAISRFARNLSTLHESGVDIVRALDIVSDTVGSVPISNAIQDVKRSVSQGKSIAGPLSQHAVFPAMTVQMLAVGEEGGNISPMLRKVAESYDSDIETMTESLTSLIEPIMIMILGVVVGGMIVALYLPIFSIYELIQ